MEWTRSETIGLASATCVYCRGLGLRKAIRSQEEKPCGCVFRAIFRACLERFQRCIERVGYTSAVSYDRSTGPEGNRTYGRKNEEFIADFELISRRTLDKQEYEAFKWHYLYGADFKACTTKMGIDKGTFYHLVYQIQQKLGRVFREMEPYALFPLDVYFGGVTEKKAHSGLKVEVMSEDRRMADQIRSQWMNETVSRGKLLEMPKLGRVSQRFPLKKLRDELKVA